ncbi:MAG: hypothetical protein JST84_01295 [Acidobacteria bacterium]|nr:hypothetical protein [Acidobacteriota bacterium]
MLHAKRPHLVIRPKQPLSWLAALGFVALGVIAANKIYGWGAWLFALIYFLVGIAFLSDRIVFDGTTLKRRGFGAWFLSLAGQSSELGLDEIEVVSSYAVRTGRDGVRYNTVISSEHVSWHISSSEAKYQRFIKAFFKAINPHVLDPLSTELLLYWREAEPAFKSVYNETANAYNIERWRRKAIRLSFDGHYEAAASYFKIAHDSAPNDAQIAYDMGRFLRRRAIAVGVVSKQGEADLLRAETYFRMAGRLAREKKNARLLEKVGEAFYEFQQLELAQKYFELATRIDPVRPRANIGLAGIALQNAQGARAVYAYHQAACGADVIGAEGLVQLANRKAEYCERLMSDDEFLHTEASWEAVLIHLKWARRGALTMFLVAWLLQLATFELALSVRTFSREISATALIIWFCALVASHIILALRRS